MKFRMNWLILIIALLGFIACDTGTTSTTSTIDDGTTTGDDTTTVSVDRSIQLVDADDTVLGYVINLHTWVGRYDFITENGYIVTIDVMGKYFPYYEDASSGIYFTGEDGTGDVYIQSWSSSVVGEPQFSNFLHYVEGSFYNYKPIVGTTYAAFSDLGAKTFLSYIDESTEAITNEQVDFTTFYGNQLEEKTLTEIGLPETINGPLSLNVITE